MFRFVTVALAAVVVFVLYVVTAGSNDSNQVPKPASVEEAPMRLN